MNPFWYVFQSLSLHQAEEIQQVAAENALDLIACD